MNSAMTQIATPPAGEYCTSWIYAQGLTGRSPREGEDLQMLAGLGSVMNRFQSRDIGIIRIDPGLLFCRHNRFTQIMGSTVYDQLVQAVDHFTARRDIHGIIISAAVTGGQIGAELDAAAISLAASSTVKPVLWLGRVKLLGAGLILASQCSRIYSFNALIGGVGLHYLTVSGESIAIEKGDDSTRAELRAAIAANRRMRHSDAARFIEGDTSQTDWLLPHEARRIGLIDDIAPGEYLDEAEAYAADKARQLARERSS